MPLQKDYSMKHLPQRCQVIQEILLKVPVQINSGAHHGGSLAFDKDRNLILSTGDGTTPFPSNGYAPLDERSDPKHYPMDAQRAAAKIAKDFALADAIRKELIAQGVVLKDSATGTTWEAVS